MITTSKLSDLRFILVKGSDVARNNIIQEFYQLRKTVFMDALKWGNLCDANGAEVDEYDGSHTEYLLVLSAEDQVIGGVRLNPTDLSFYASQFAEFKTSYMIRDAYFDRLEGIPKELCFLPPPQSPVIFEATRLIAPNLNIAKRLFLAANEYFLEKGVIECLFLTNPSFLPIGRKLGFVVKPLGPVMGEEENAILAMSYIPAARKSEKGNTA